MLAAAVLLLAGTMLVHCAILWAGFRRLMHDIAGVTPVPRDERPTPGSTLEQAVADFHAHVVRDAAGRLHRTTSAETFLQDHAITQAYIPIRHLTSMVNVLLTIGILATFISLAQGLPHATNLEAATQYVGQALMSSIAGLIASLTFSVVLTLTLEQARARVRSLALTIDGWYPLVTLEQIQYQILERSSPEAMCQVIRRAIREEHDDLGRILARSVHTFAASWTRSIDTTLTYWSNQIAEQSTASVRVSLQKAAEAFGETLDKTLDGAQDRMAKELGPVLASIRTASAEVEEKFAGIADAYEAFNRQHEKFRLDVEQRTLEAADWHDAAMRGEIERLIEWSREFSTSLNRLTEGLDALTAAATRTIANQTEQTAARQNGDLFTDGVAHDPPAAI